MSKEVQLTLSLTEQQAEFLKQFAAKQYPGAKDNLCTVYPIHVVENTRYTYIPYHEDLTDYFDDDTLSFSFDDDREMWSESETQLIEDYMEYKDEYIRIPIVPFAAMQGKEMNNVNGEIVEVEDYDDYFKVYGIENVAMCWKEKHYEPAAFFLIREEAEKYMKYQRHNLIKPRIFSHAAGYDNRGDFPDFWELLMKAGTQLNETEKGVDSHV